MLTIEQLEDIYKEMTNSEIGNTSSPYTQKEKIFLCAYNIYPDYFKKQVPQINWDELKINLERKKDGIMLPPFVNNICSQLIRFKKTYKGIRESSNEEIIKFKSKCEEAEIEEEREHCNVTIANEVQEIFEEQSLVMNYGKIKNYGNSDNYGNSNNYVKRDIDGNRENKVIKDNEQLYPLFLYAFNKLTNDKLNFKDPKYKIEYKVYTQIVNKSEVLKQEYLKKTLTNIFDKVDIETLKKINNIENTITYINYNYKNGEKHIIDELIQGTIIINDHKTKELINNIFDDIILKLKNKKLSHIDIYDIVIECFIENNQEQLNTHNRKWYTIMSEVKILKKLILISNNNNFSIDIDEILSGAIKLDKRKRLINNMLKEIRTIIKRVKNPIKFKAELKSIIRGLGKYIDEDNIKWAKSYLKN